MKCEKKFNKAIVSLIIMANFLGLILSAGAIKSTMAKEPVNIYKSKEITTINGNASVGKGTASILIEGNKGQTLKGKKFHLYKLLCAENAIGGESINYTINPEFEHALRVVVADELAKKGQSITTEKTTKYMILDYIKSLDQSPVEGADTTQKPQGNCSEYRFFVEAVRNQIANEKISPQIIHVDTIKRDNSFEISGLEYGYYILDEVSMVAGTDSAASLCMVGTANPKVVIKVKSDYPTVVKKIKEDDKSLYPLIKDATGWNDIGDFETGQNVPYRFVSNIPNINGYSSYYYAWHDKMDPELTLRENSVKVSIQGKNGSSDKTYNLLDKEFSLEMETPQKDSFKIIIQDIKKIIDREFPNFNNKNENEYGQKVVVTYDAVINEKIVENDGIPTIENNVRLEFSNNPDGNNTSSTGYTPWDTVVCYTYKLNIKKTNDKNKILENAKFHLYSDPKCRNEVYVKECDKGYMVINRDQISRVDHIEGIKPENSVEMKTRADGTILIYGIDSGTYYLKETKAPAGYRTLEEPVIVQIKAIFTDDRDAYVKGEGKAGKTLKNLEAKANIKSFYNGKQKVEDIKLSTEILTGKVNLTVVNQIGRKLPVTGNSVTLIMVLSGSAIMGYAIIRKGRKNEK